MRSTLRLSHRPAYAALAALVAGTLLAATSLATTAPAIAAPPAGWILAGSDPSSYEIRRDATMRHGTSASALLASTKESSGFGTMMQIFQADEYRGKRMRLSGWVKADTVADWAGLWMRVDGEGRSPKTLAFDNMQSRAIKGTRDWTRYDVVLDVAAEAQAIAFGILLAGEGKVWLSDVKFEAVPTTVPTTDTLRGSKSAPENLDFAH